MTTANTTMLAPVASLVVNTSITRNAELGVENIFTVNFKVEYPGWKHYLTECFYILMIRDSSCETASAYVMQRQLCGGDGQTPGLLAKAMRKRGGKTAVLIGDFLCEGSDQVAIAMDAIITMLDTMASPSGVFVTDTLLMSDLLGVMSQAAIAEHAGSCIVHEDIFKRFTDSIWENTVGSNFPVVESVKPKFLYEPGGTLIYDQGSDESPDRFLTARVFRISDETSVGWGSFLDTDNFNLRLRRR